MFIQKLLLLYLRRFPVEYGKQIVAKWIGFPNHDGFVDYTNKQGVKFQLDLKEYQMKQIFLLDVYERNTIRQLLRLVKQEVVKPFVFMDVGANIGFFSMTVAKDYKINECQIHCFEPNPYTFNLLKTNLQNNGFNNVYLNMVGLGERETTAVLTSNAENIGAANIYSENKGGIQTNIQIRTLDGYCKDLGINRVDIIKVDIEGAELNFLKGAENIIANSEKLILVMEIVDQNCKRAGYSAEELFKYCLSKGFVAYLPKPWPFGLKKAVSTPLNYQDNIIFLKGYN